MSLAVALAPHPPLLFRELGGAADPVADLRAACAAALDRLLHPAGGPPDTVVVVGPADEPGPVAGAPDVRRYGTTGPRPVDPGLPLSLGVGRRLLDDAGWAGATELVGVDWDATPEEVAALADALVARPGRTAVLLLGDGGARRGEKAPGYLDDRAVPFDDAVTAALRDGDAAALAGLDTGLARELMVLGRTTFRLLGELGLRRPPADPEVLHAEDPFGVLYLVAHWRLDHAGEAGATGANRPA